MQQKIIAYMKQHKMIGQNDHVVVGCSGGADSVCLLLLLHACEKELGFYLSAIHVEHGIRGEESRQDAQFTEKLCRRLEIPLRVCPVDVPSYAKEHKLGLEEAARELRYAEFVRFAKEQDGAVKIALAHHQEDNAETMLFALARGSGLAGLGGILPVRQEAGFCVIRPLLCADRGEIEQYLADCGQAYCTDRTNLDERYSRNRIRGSILPQLSAVNAQAVLHMNQSAEKICEAYDFIRTTAEKRYRELVTEENGALVVSAPALQSEHPAVCQEILRMLLFQAAGHRKNISTVHVEELFGLLKLQSGRRISLPYGICAYMEYDMLHVCKEGTACEETPAPDAFWVSPEVLRAAGAEKIPDNACSCTENPTEQAKPWTLLWDDGHGSSLYARVWETAAPLEEITKKTYTKQFDYDKINSGFLVRTRQKGDFFVLDAQGHRKKLSDYMVNEKIPARLRDTMPLLARESEVLWLIGGRISASCKVTKDTTRILEMKFHTMEDS
jgi:tRNA(Ile)-lysidine synthase